MIKRKLFTRIIAVIMVMVTVFGAIPLSASAATWGTTGSKTISVKTHANYWYPGASSITLKQNKQTATFQSLLGTKTKTQTGFYGCYTITVKNVTKNTSKSITWNGGQTKKIELDPNCTYNITVTYNSAATNVFKSAPLGYYLKSMSNPYWKVSSTWKVTSFY